jgi:prepilin-type N-terminal cleavage/methylation domain-containing protein
MTAMKKNLQNKPTARRRAFTLIELLAVITIIGVLAAFTIPVLSSVKRQQYIKNAQAEMEQLKTAIQRYHDAYGFYPPDSTNTVNNIPANQLYYELIGTTNINPASAVYQLLDGSGASLTAVQLNAAYNVSGFINCSKPGAGEDAAAAKIFISGLKPKQMGIITNNSVPTLALLCTVGGPDPNYPFSGSDANPWRYNSSNPTNNPGGYDLWIQLKIGGKLNLICNWSKQVQINSPLP